METLADIVGLAHFAAALLALAVGLAVLVGQKGTRRHRLLGTVYVVDMVVLNAAGLALHREDVFGPFHLLALVSLTTVVVGFSLLRWGTVSPSRVAVHGYLMGWSYVGLVGAGTGQVAVQFGFTRYVLWTILATLVVGGLLVHTLTPRTLDRMFQSTE